MELYTFPCLYPVPFELVSRKYIITLAFSKSLDEKPSNSNLFVTKLPSHRSVSLLVSLCCLSVYIYPSPSLPYPTPRIHSKESTIPPQTPQSERKKSEREIPRARFATHKTPPNEIPKNLYSLLYVPGFDLKNYPSEWPSIYL